MEVLIFGDGPAAHVASIAVHSAGGRVVRALPRPGLGPPPTHRHTHVIAEDLHINAAAIDADLGAALRAGVEPGWRFRWDNGSEWTGHVGPHLLRETIVAVLKAHLSRIAPETWHDAQITARQGDRLEAASRDRRRQFDLVIDATGTHRATLPMLARLGQGPQLQSAGRPLLYQTLALAFPQPSENVQWGSTPLDDPLGALYGDIIGRRMRITLSVPDDLRGRPLSMDDLRQRLNPRVRGLIPDRSAIVDHTSAVLPQMRRLRYRDDGLPNWIALGDARVQWAPRMGTGLGSLFRQSRILADALRRGAAPSEVRADLDAYVDNMWDLNMQVLRVRQTARTPETETAAPATG